MAFVTALNRANIGPGEITSPNVTVPTGTTRVAIRPNPLSADWTPDLLMTLAAERSDDGGATWQHWFGFTMEGGTLDKLGNVPTQITTFPPTPAGRLARCVLTLSARVRIGADIEVS